MEWAADSMARLRPDDLAELRLALPGLLHSLSNALFAIQGHAARVGSTTPDLEAEKEAILGGAGLAQGAVEVLGHLAGEGVRRPVQADQVLKSLCDILRVPLREGGLHLELRDSKGSSRSAAVRGSVLCRALSATIGALLHAMPEGFRGRVLLEMVAGTRERLDILVQIRAVPSLLPFPMHLERVVESLGPRLRPWGAEISGPEPEQILRISLPTVRPETQPPSEAAQHELGSSTI